VLVPTQSLVTEGIAKLAQSALLEGGSARGARDPLLQRGDFADLRDHLPSRTRALLLLRGGRARALPPLLTGQVRVRDLLEARDAGAPISSGR
jgi:hypothetical protein